MDYLNAFLCGGLLCAIGQILIDKTPLTPARILTGYVVCGVLLTAIGVYEPIVKWGGAGATVPLLARQGRGKSRSRAGVARRDDRRPQRHGGRHRRSGRLCCTDGAHF